METSQLRKFASFARQSLLEQVETKLSRVLAEGSLARKENPRTVQQLEARIKELGQQQTIEMVAYTWFNRFCALRYMDVNRYTKVGVVSPAEGQFQPEMLADAKMGHINEEIVPAGTRERVMRLLDQTDPSDDPQGEAYRLLLVAVCNHYHSLMPFMFEKIADYTELLLPDDLLSGNSILAEMREALIPENCSPEHTDESVEVIGWLYQFYIADRKDDVFAALKKGKKITPENIPAATQLFTPHWIVRYLVENSLGRLWMLNHPDSKLVEQMDYYIKPDSGEPDASARDHEHDAGTLTEASGAEVSLANASGYEEDFLKISSPEEIKICDPACGSGHMLTYAFDLLYAIYEEQGYQATDIPRLILTHNLYGIEIDQRAGALAAFALTMKAREKYRRFLTGGKVVQPNICVLENISIDPEDLDAYLERVGRDLFSGGLQGVVNQWEEADNFGSLIRPLVTDVTEVLELLRMRQMGEDLFLAGVHQKVLTALRQADYLSPKYHVVVANPPYMGRKGMNASLSKWSNQQFPESKSDLFAMFIDRFIDTAMSHSYCAVVTMQSWMFLGSYEELRKRLTGDAAIECMAHMDNMVMGIAFGTAATVFKKRPDPFLKGSYCFVELADLGNGSTPRTFPPENERNVLAARRGDPFFRISISELEEIPGQPLAYWVSEETRLAFKHGSALAEIAKPRAGLQTGCNELFLRSWSEVSLCNIGLNIASREEAVSSKVKWFPYNKGGDWRKWYGNCELVVNWENDGEQIRGFTDEKGKPRSAIRNADCYFRKGITWSDITTKSFAARSTERGFLFDVKGSSGFPSDKNRPLVLGLMNSRLMHGFMLILNPTSTFQVGDISRIPLCDITNDSEAISKNVDIAIQIGRDDWDSFETSWDFARSPLLELKTAEIDQRLVDIIESALSHWNDRLTNLRNCEFDNNKRLIHAYGLQSELNPELKLDELTLFTNPHYRYGSDKSESELEALLLADTMREFISYAVGCMLGRYSLDKPGLILANQGETADDYRQQIPEPTFAPDEDNVIPLLDGDWFEDDITERFKAFLKVTFGNEHYEENLTFLENALYPDNLTGKKRKSIRDYFLKEFYNHHVKLYKKRPIYWMFSSPKGTFNALVYLHRYRPDTVSTVLQYLRDFQEKLAHRRDHLQAVADSGSASQSEKTKALKEVATLKKQLKELEDYESATLFPLAQKRIEIDLDDGVKHNYPIFGKALKKVTGLSGK